MVTQLQSGMSLLESFFFSSQLFLISMTAQLFHLPLTKSVFPNPGQIYPAGSLFQYKQSRK